DDAVGRHVAGRTDVRVAGAEPVRGEILDEACETRLLEPPVRGNTHDRRRPALAHRLREPSELPFVAVLAEAGRLRSAAPVQRGLVKRRDHLDVRLAVERFAE